MNWKPTKRAIGDIKCGICNSYVEAKVMDMWKIEDNTNTGEFYSIEMILIDEKGCVIQATIGKCLIKRWEDKIKNGHSYKITRFQSIYNKGNHIVVPHSCRLKFGYATTVEEIAIEALSTYGLKFISFKNIVDNNLKICPLKGVDEHVGEKVNEDELPLWFWGPYVCEATKIARVKYFTVDKPIVALQCVQWNMTQEIPKTMKGNTSKIYINPPIHEVHALRASLAKLPIIKKDIVGMENNDITYGNCKSLDEITLDWKTGKFITTAYIAEIDVTFGWYKNVCKNISDDLNDAPTEVVEFKDGNTNVTTENISGITAESSTKWSQEEIGSIGNVETGKEEDKPNGQPCPLKCIGMKSAIPRFQVKFFVTFKKANIYEFIIWDDLMQELLGKTAQEILDEDEMYSRTPPPYFHTFLDKEFIVKIKVTKQYNIEQKSTTYGVINLSDDKRTLTKWDQMNDNADKDNMRELMEGEASPFNEEISNPKELLSNSEIYDKSSATKNEMVNTGKRNLII
ncbi:hypothetical protein KSS87_012118 [Heliosperma pusillum]|nr:hypothetical protein KSS87_012118 [Heliosperma pusillum]